jgi:NodT family efflux transporter outer membrane factor (OMF) lipoprotein
MNDPGRKKLSFRRSACIHALRSMMVLTLGLNACASVGPDYVKPELTPPDAWHSTLDDGLQPAAVAPEMLARWWTTLNDPLLTDIMERAVRGNLDLQTAQARVREARARRGISQAAYFPAVDANGSYTKTRASESTTPFGDRDSELYSATLDAGWEIDIFGGVRRSVEAADADLAASQEDLNGVLVSLLAETALNYVDVRTLQSRIEVAEANVKVLDETYQLTQSRFKAGLTDELAVQGALYLLDGTRSQIPVLKTRLEAAMNRVAVLLGGYPGAMHAELMTKAPVPVPPKNVAVGVPAETLRSRPDVRRAERQLAAQTARIGVAKADLYPRFSLIGTIGYQSLESDTLFEGDSLGWVWGPNVSWGIFKGGAVLRNIDVQEARQEQALKQYQATVLGALEESESALASYVGEQQRRDSLVTATRAASQAFLLARNQYEAGLVDFSVVLIAQQAMLSYEDQLAQSEGTVTTNLVRLYKSLGGGWTAQGSAVSNVGVKTVGKK